MSEDVARSTKTNVALHPGEKDLLDQAARRAGLRRAAYMRMVSLRAATDDIQEHQDAHPLRPVPAASSY